MQSRLLTPVTPALLLLFISPVGAQVAGSGALHTHITNPHGGPSSAQPAVVDAAARLAADLVSELLHVVPAGNARPDREVTGPADVETQRVPADPVASGAHDGVGHERLGYAAFWSVIDPVADVGFVHARWKDSDGRWSYSREVTAPPPQPTAVRLEADAAQTELVTDGVQPHGCSHGNTEAGGPLMTSMFQHLARHGPTRVKLSGIPLIDPLAGATAPDWFGALQVTDGGRGDEDGAVRTSNGGSFSPELPEDRATDLEDLEVQLTPHDEPLPPGSAVANLMLRHRFY